MRRALVICALVGCTTFEDPSIVLDLRVLSMKTEPPDQVVDVDLEAPSTTGLIAQLRPTSVEVLVADPTIHRSLRWGMTLCLLDDEARCDRSLPTTDLGSGVIEDPEDADSAQHPNAIVFPDITMLALLQKAVEREPISALGGVDLSIVFTVRGVDDPPEADIYAAKTLRVSPRVPALRTANANPRIDYLDAAIAGVGVTLTRKRCSDPGVDFEVPFIRAGATVTLFPVETGDTRQEYLAPTLDGGATPLTETITYQWLSANGSWSDETTGGGHDILGNQSLLGSDWTAPRGVGQVTKVPVWMIQRDERFGVMALETCFAVMP